MTFCVGVFFITFQKKLVQHIKIATKKHYINHI